MKPVNIRWVTLILLLSMLVNLAGCGGYTVQAEDLMKDIEPAKVQGKEADDTFREAQMAFALELFRQSAGRSEKENVLVSPLSMMLVLAMTANGAEGDTKAEMEAMLGLPIAELNEYLYSYVNALPSTKKSKMQIANSIWMRQNDLTVKKDFLQANANYYGADAYQGPFDAQTLKDINGWVEDKTVALFYTAYCQTTIGNFVAVVFTAFIGTIVDSILGSLVQRKYICPRCNKITERKTHCCTQTRLFGGIGFVDNTCVNFFSNMLTFVIAIIVAISLKI